MNHLDAEVELRLSLQCLSGSTPEDSPYLIITIPSVHCTILDVKEQIEAAADIPVVLQKLQYGAAVLHDDDCLDTLRLRSGDTLEVSYYAKAECLEIRACIDWLRRLVRAFSSDRVPLIHSNELEMSEEVRRVMAIIAVREHFMIELSYKHFFPWLSPMKYANKLFFIVNGGLEAIMQLHAQLQRVSWHWLPEKLKDVECTILSTLWNLAESFQIRRAMVHYNALKACTSSMLRVEIKKNAPLTDVCPGRECYFAQRIIDSALGILTKYDIQVLTTHLLVFTLTPSHSFPFVSSQFG